MLYRVTLLLLFCASAYASEVETQLDEVVTRYRKSIVILAAQQPDDELTRQKTTAVGMVLFEENHQTLHALERDLLAELEALTAFSKAAELDPKNAQAVNNLGFLYFTLEEYAKAQEWLERTVSLDPSRYVAYMNLGDNLEKLGRHQEAMEAYAKYLELAPANEASKRVRQLIEEN